MNGKTGKREVACVLLIYLGVVGWQAAQADALAVFDREFEYAMRKSEKVARQ